MMECSGFETWVQTLIRQWLPHLVNLKNLVLKFDISIIVSSIDRLDVLNRCISSPHKGFGFSLDKRLMQTLIRKLLLVIAMQF